MNVIKIPFDTARVIAIDLEIAGGVDVDQGLDLVPDQGLDQEKDDIDVGHDPDQETVQIVGEKGKDLTVVRAIEVEKGALAHTIMLTDIEKDIQMKMELKDQISKLLNISSRERQEMTGDLNSHQ